MIESASRLFEETAIERGLGALLETGVVNLLGNVGQEADKEKKAGVFQTMESVVCQALCMNSLTALTKDQGTANE